MNREERRIRNHIHSYSEMPTVDPKPAHRPFRRVLYREDSKDPTMIKDVSPRIGGHLITRLKRSHTVQGKEHDLHQTMSLASRKLLIDEGTLYRSPREKIKYIKIIPNDPMARYLFHMQKFNHSSLGIASIPENAQLP